MKKKRPNPYLIDDENPEWTREDFKRAVPLKVMFPDLYQALKRGRPALESPKVQTTIRLDADVLKALKAGGRGWQTRLNDLLRAAVLK
ncbi:MAG: BrnA antitoxin family protein [Rickettsiales bacterium]